jgi:hypothetical protein
MKEAYLTPEIEIIEFDNEDVITTSSVNNGGNMPDDGLDWSPLTPVN